MISTSCFDAVRWSRRLQYPRQARSEFRQHFQPAGADHDRHESKFVHNLLQERKLNFQGVLAGVRNVIVPQRRKLAFEFLRQRLRRWRLLPAESASSPAHDGERLPCPGVIRAEDDKAARQFQPRIDRAGDMSGIHVAGVRHHAAEGAESSPARVGQSVSISCRSLLGLEG